MNCEWCKYYYQPCGFNTNHQFNQLLIDTIKDANQVKQTGNPCIHLT